MWTGEWWWRIQVHNKTQLSQFCSDKTAWPVYLTIGNIGKDTQQELSSHATILLSYLPVPKFDCYSDKLCSVMKYHMFHQCMSIIMHSVTEAGNTGVPIVCTDSLICYVHPIFVVYIANYSEQCLIGCCMENRCPICKVDPGHQGTHQVFDKYNVTETLSLLEVHKKEETTETFGMVYQPFWSMLPHSDIFIAFTPDLLHQLHKGVFKDHLMKWCMTIIGAVEVDKAFQMMPSHPGLHHFKNGILHILQWTGSEHKEMEKVFLALVTSHTC
ncbi:hypothetical protein EDD18DRAFT_1310528 [Armillaria luteobubalina]|uniref:Uncharacterized protein n=1 Tax=Armillaria luteobubalina TaxID=153913 RepID=A0AA39UV36_9AGAR|nr:hypothetical protein EDD18DRAFT_1310528 [Armillaria luteobubalina]